jgi:hypothetical protein
VVSKAKARVTKEMIDAEIEELVSHLRKDAEGDEDVVLRALKSYQESIRLGQVL